MESYIVWVLSVTLLWVRDTPPGNGKSQKNLKCNFISLPPHHCVQLSLPWNIRFVKQKNRELFFFLTPNRVYIWWLPANFLDILGQFHLF